MSTSTATTAFGAAAAVSSRVLLAPVHAGSHAYVQGTRPMAHRVRGPYRDVAEVEGMEVTDNHEDTLLLSYTTATLNNINSNHVNHRLLKGSRRGVPQPSSSEPSTSGIRAGGGNRRQRENPFNRPDPAEESLSRAGSGRALLSDPVASTSVVLAPEMMLEEQEHDCKVHGCERVRINVSGQYFETRIGLLNRHPDTLLGNPRKRQRFYDRTRDEFFIDRHRPSFEAVFAYFQYGGKLKRPHNVPDDIFLTELYFYELETEVINEYRTAEGYVDDDVIMPDGGCMKTIWMLFEYPETSNLAFVIAIVSVIMTVTSIVLFCVETLPVFSMTHCVEDAAPNFLDPFFIIETTCTAWFTIELFIRFVVCPSKLGFWKDFKNIVDLTAIIPYYVTFFNVISTMSCASAKSSASLAFLRVIRLVRIFKLTKHSVGLQVLILTFKASIEGLGLFLVALMVCLLVFSSAIYYAEFGIKDSQIHSIPDAFWWAIITMTTVGYGDKVPIGPWGRLIGCICALVGVLTLAIPVPIITGNFNRFYSHRTGRGKHI